MATWDTPQCGNKIKGVCDWSDRVEWFLGYDANEAAKHAIGKPQIDRL